MKKTAAKSKVEPKVEPKMKVEIEAPVEEAPVLPPEPSIPAVATDQSLSSETEATLAGQSLTEEVPLEKNNRRLWRVGVGILVLIAGLVGGVYYLWNRLNTAEPAPVAVSSTPTPLASSSPLPRFNRGEMSVEVLNGSGKTGKAAEVSDDLKTLGYDADKVGNAPEEASRSMVYLSAKAESFRTEILADLEKWGVETAAQLIGGTTEIKIVLGSDVK